VEVVLGGVCDNKVCGSGKEIGMTTEGTWQQKEDGHGKRGV